MKTSIESQKQKLLDQKVEGNELDSKLNKKRRGSRQLPLNISNYTELEQEVENEFPDLTQRNMKPENFIQKLVDQLKKLGNNIDRAIKSADFSRELLGDNSYYHQSRRQAREYYNSIY